jgi:hypothetical protein
MAVQRKQTDSVDRIEKLIATQSRSIRKAFLEFVKQIRNERTLGELADLLEQGRLEEAQATIRKAAEQVSAAHNAAFVKAGETAASVISKAVLVTVSFDQVNERAVDYMRQEKFRLIREIDGSQRRAIRQALVSGIQAGHNPVQQARNFRNAIGLTENQAQAVVSYRRALENLESDALRRALRDKRFDAQVAQAIRQEKKLTQAQINRMTDRYYERSVQHRSKVIARTEALRAVNSGNHEAYRQAIADGILDPAEVERTWNTAGDSRTRDTHRGMSGQTRMGVEEPFTSPEGATLRFPGDPLAPPAETIQCRCAVSTRLRPAD